MATLANRLQDIELLDADGNPVRLGDAWDQRPALVVFIRQFG